MTLELDTVERLIILLHRKGWTQGEAAERLGVPVRTIRAWLQRSRSFKPIVGREIERFIEENLK